jgi:hypothetical protein
MLTRRSLVWLALTGAVMTRGAWAQGTDLPAIEVFKLPDCTCCKNWIKYLERHGYRVTVTDLADVAARAAKQEQLGVPAHLRACHTAVVAGYVIEGHVAADEIERLLRERPPIKGLYVKGMPKGAPGMAGGEPERYEVIALDAAGNETTFAVHEPD